MISARRDLTHSGKVAKSHIQRQHQSRFIAALGVNMNSASQNVKLEVLATSKQSLLAHFTTTKMS